MPDWKDPIIVAQDYLILAKIIHIVAGIAIWEFVVTCDFELAVLTGRRPYRWTIWIYVGCRVSLLVTLICGIIPLEYTKCRPWDIAAYTSAYFAIGLASSMIVLRIIAIWDRNVYACGLAIAVWLGSFALNIRHVTLVHSVYNPVAGVCIPLDTVNNLANGIGIMVSDIGLLALMLAGILRHQPYVHMKLLGRNSLWALLWNQGLMWLVIASVAEVPALVLLSLNLNDPLNQMLAQPMVGILSIGATRMYRALSTYTLFTEFHLTSFSVHTPTEAVRIRRTHAVHRDDDTWLAESNTATGLPTDRIHLDFDRVLDAGRNKGARSDADICVQHE